MVRKLFGRVDEAGANWHRDEPGPRVVEIAHCCPFVVWKELKGSTDRDEPGGGRRFPRCRHRPAVSRAIPPASSIGGAARNPRSFRISHARSRGRCRPGRRATAALANARPFELARGLASASPGPFLPVLAPPARHETRCKRSG